MSLAWRGQAIGDRILRYRYFCTHAGAPSFIKQPPCINCDTTVVMIGDCGSRCKRKCRSTILPDRNLSIMSSRRNFNNFGPVLEMRRSILRMLVFRPTGRDVSRIRSARFYHISSPIGKSFDEIVEAHVQLLLLP